MARLAAEVNGWLATSRPDVVLLQAGTNDLRTAGGANGAAARLSALVTRIVRARPRAQVFVAKVTGVRGDPILQARTDAFNRAVPLIVARHGPRVHLVDQSGVRGLDIRDVRHPNDFGFAKMSWNWYRALEPVYRVPGRVWPADGDPGRARQAWRCLLVDRDPGRGYRPDFDCRWWHRRAVVRTVGGIPTTVLRWQTRRVVTVRYRVRVGDDHVLRTRRVTRWFGA